MTSTDDYPPDGTYAYDVADGESVSTAVVMATSALTGRPATALPRLAHTVDPDALDALCTSFSDGERAIVSFTYAGVDVTVYGTARVEVEPPRT